eukprot:scaffold654_cov207-Ochromonas_danica.AAC.9
MTTSKAQKVAVAHCYVHDHVQLSPWLLTKGCYVLIREHLQPSRTKKEVLATQAQVVLSWGCFVI